MSNTTRVNGTRNYVATGTKLVSENYPYGYTLRTTKYDWLEFKKGKGFRHVSQTINPKTGRLNAPKAGTYSMLMLLWQDENNHVKSFAADFNGDEQINRTCQFIANHFELFTPEQINFFYSELVTFLIVSIKAQVMYCGSNFEDLKPLFNPSIEIAKQGLKEGGNLFSNIVLDIETINAKKVPDFNPFVVTNTFVIGQSNN